jgi:hypothetical protein
MTGLEFAAIFGSILIFGSLILDRLPKPKKQNHFNFEICDEHVYFRVDTVLEDDFKIGFVNEWDVGRSFELYGSVLPIEGKDKANALPFGDRTGVKIGPVSDWFESSRLGQIKVYERGGCQSFVALPYQIARHVLDDVRRNPDHVVTLGFKRETDKNGKSAFPIFSFELSKPLD